MSLPRILAVELWPVLQRQRWHGQRSWRDLSDYGANRAFSIPIKGQVPKSPSQSTHYVNASRDTALVAFAKRQNHPDLVTDLSLVLTLDAYQFVTDALRPDARADWYLALEDAPKPFRYKTDGDGRRALSSVDDPYLTHRVLDTLADLVHLLVLHDLSSEPPTPVALHPRLTRALTPSVAEPACQDGTEA
jgi:hypothetical protein